MISKIYVVLPVYNESRSIYNLLAAFNDFFKEYSADNEIIAINDHSTDDTRNWILKAKEDFPTLNINNINHEINKGLEGSLKTGFSMLNNISETEILITMDGDNTHNPYLIREMANKINEGADIVIASRYCEQSRVHGLNKLRLLLSSGARYLYSFRWHIKGVKDYTCGFRAYKGWLVKQTLDSYNDNFIQERGFTATSEILIKMSKFNPVITEVPMILRYSNKTEASSMNIVKTITLTIKMLFR